MKLRRLAFPVIPVREKNSGAQRQREKRDNRGAWRKGKFMRGGGTGS